MLVPSRPEQGGKGVAPSGTRIHTGCGASILRSSRSGRARRVPGRAAERSATSRARAACAMEPKGPARRWFQKKCVLSGHFFLFRASCRDLLAPIGPSKPPSLQRYAWRHVWPPRRDPVSPPTTIEARFPKAGRARAGALSLTQGARKWRQHRLDDPFCLWSTRRRSERLRRAQR